MKYPTKLIADHSPSNETELKQRIRVPVAHFDERGQEWAFWVCEDWIDQPARKRSRRWFEHYGLRLSTELPRMIADRILPPLRRLPDIEVRRVRGADTWDAFCRSARLAFTCRSPGSGKCSTMPWCGTASSAASSGTWMSSRSRPPRLSAAPA